jgi:hypothetical protein
LRRLLQLYGFLRILVADQVLARIAAAHADEAIEHQLQIAGRPVPVHRPDDRPSVGQVEPLVHAQIPHEIRLVLVAGW